METIILEQEQAFQGYKVPVKVFKTVNQSLEELRIGETVASFTIEDNGEEAVLYSLEANGEEDDVYLEVVHYQLVEHDGKKNYVDQSHSDCIWDLPTTPSETVDLLMDYAETLTD
jgi:hypothetical protein